MVSLPLVHTTVALSYPIFTFSITVEEVVSGGGARRLIRAVEAVSHAVADLLLVDAERIVIAFKPIG